MSHIRQQIRDAVASALTGLPTTGNRVSMNRVASVAAADTPCLAIHVESEALSNLRLVGPTHYQRVLQIDIDAFASGAALDDQLDDICLEVEVALDAAGNLAGLLDYPLELDAVRIEFEDLASPPLAVARLRYVATTATLAATPDIRA